MVTHARPGTLVGGRYRLLEVAGAGGMASVWRAVVEGGAGFRRPVAVKQIHDHLATSQLYVDMFVEEARVGSRLQDGNIAQVYDFCVEDEQYFLVLEWVEGIDLGSYLRYWQAIGEQTPWEIVCAVGIAVLRALAAAHERVGEDGVACPVVHRDISPGNVLLGAKGPVKLIDFGLALTGDRTGDLTNPGIVKGKLAYLAPEIVQGLRATPASDQYAVGAVLWEALAGRRLFEGANDLEIYKRVRDGQVRPLRSFRPDVPRELGSIVHRALSTHVQYRFGSTREMAHQLGQTLRGARLRKDLLETLGKTVGEARRHLELGGRTRTRDTNTPVVDALPEESASFEKDRALWRRLPFLGKKGR